jgi:hypothetical protein
LVTALDGCGCQNVAEQVATLQAGAAKVKRALDAYKEEALKVHWLRTVLTSLSLIIALRYRLEDFGAVFHPLQR